VSALPRFPRRFFGSGEPLSAIGTGEVGGKAAGLQTARAALEGFGEARRLGRLGVDVPTLTVIGTDVFDSFMQRNSLLEAELGELPDHRIALLFQRAELPPEVVGDLWALVAGVTRPLAVRSSSRLEDALAHPFAGVYETKLTPNDQSSAETRFRKLIEAVKFVYASTFFKAARAYRAALGSGAPDEKMAVVVQEVVGRRHGSRFYPDVSLVARSLGFYPIGPARPEDGVASLALGLGKTIVDGGRCWTYCPRYPRAVPPYATPAERFDAAQRSFWAVNMGEPVDWDPMAETEYLLECPLGVAADDGTLGAVASSYDPHSGRLTPGLGRGGSPVVDFAPLREFSDFPLHEAVDGLLRLFEERAGAPVEIELALTIERERARLGFLQVRPMGAGAEPEPIAERELGDPRAVVAATGAVGHGRYPDLRDVLFVKREGFERAKTREVAREIERLNAGLLAEGLGCVLIGFGRWGSADPWLGIPVAWGDVSSARVIVEAGLPDLEVEPSQGSHFFHNLLSFGVAYLSVTRRGGARIDWEWLAALPRHAESEHVVHARAPQPLEVRVDARSGRGLILRGAP